MACDLCDSCETSDDPIKTEPPRWCDDEPKRPDPPSCDGAGSGASCDPDAKMRDLQQALDASKAEFDEAKAALEKVTELRTGFDAAIELYRQDAEARAERKCECGDFVRCKKPEELDPCIDKQIDAVCKFVHRLEQYGHFVNWAAARAEMTVRQKQWMYDRSKSEYDQLKDMADKCYAQCVAARERYDKACKAGDKKLMNLYWSIANRLEGQAKGCCEDYEQKLCEAFEALARAAEDLNQAKREATQKTTLLESVKKELEQYSKWEYLWDRIEWLVKQCCGDCAEGEPSKGHYSQTSEPSSC